MPPADQPAWTGRGMRRGLAEPVTSREVEPRPGEKCVANQVLDGRMAGGPWQGGAESWQEVRSEELNGSGKKLGPWRSGGEDSGRYRLLDGRSKGAIEWIQSRPERVWNMTSRSGME